MKLDAKLRSLLKQAGYDKPGKITVDKKQTGKTADGKHLLNMTPKDYYCAECGRHLGMFCFDGGTKKMACHKCQKMVDIVDEWVRQ